MERFWRMAIISREDKRLFSRDYFGCPRYCHNCGTTHIQPTLTMRLQIGWDFMFAVRKVRKQRLDGFVELCEMQNDTIVQRLKQAYWLANDKRVFLGRPPWLTGGV